MTTSTQPIIHLQDVRKAYKGHTAVDGINLAVMPGEIFGILGPNGAGKTTTLEMIEGLRTPDSGTITVNGLDAVSQAEKVRKIIGVQLQTTSLFPYLNAQELVELFASLYGVAQPKQRSRELLGAVTLTEKARNRVEELSGGQQQRLSIALALVNAPLVTFLDEPTTGLDPHARRRLWETIQRVREAGTTIVLTTHYMDEAEVLCDRIAIMDSGRVITCDTPDRLIASLPHAATVTAVTATPGAENVLTEARLSQIPGASRVAYSRDDRGFRAMVTTSAVQETLIAMLSIASDAGLQLSELTSTRPTLEDVFLASTGRALAADEPAAAEPTSRKQR